MSEKDQIFNALKGVYQGMVTPDNYREVRAEYQSVLPFFRKKHNGLKAELPQKAPESVKQLFNQL